MGLSFFRERTIAPGDKKRSLSFTFTTGSLHEIGTREEQQDAFRVLDISALPPDGVRGVLAAVADGMGGLSDGSRFSAAAIDCLSGFEDYYRRSKGNTSALLMHLLREVIRRISALFADSNNPVSSPGGTTFLAAAIFGENMSFISVGDSRIYLMRGGSLIQLNREHAYSVELDDNAVRGEISFEAAATDPQRRALTGYLGMKPPALIDRNASPLRLLPGDYVLLMTDGVFGSLTEDEIARAVSGAAGESAARLGRAVLDKARTNQDNFTAIIVECV